MKINRAFFCAVKVQESGMVNIGGFSDNETVTKNVTMKKCGWRTKVDYIGEISERSLPELPVPLSGHGCSKLPDSNDILVSGGSRHQEDNPQWTTFLLSWDDNKWDSVGNMNFPRFGHRVITVGEKVFAIGGKKGYPELFLDTIERYDINARSWSIEARKLTKPRVHFGIALIPRSIVSEKCKMGQN